MYMDIFYPGKKESMAGRENPKSNIMIFASGTRTYFQSDCAGPRIARVVRFVLPLFRLTVTPKKSLEGVPNSSYTRTLLNHIKYYLN
jgi:hypothetical protein